MFPKILTIGDSITHGVIYSGSDTESGGYRTELYNLFGSDNFDVDFVGPRSNGPSNIDKNHAGNRGWRTDEILNGRVSEPEIGKLDDWLNTYQADVVLLTIGTNDVLQNYDLGNADDRLKEIVDKITTKLPNSHLFLGSIPNSYKYADDLQQVANFNSQALQIVNNKVAQGKNVTYVDINSKLNQNDLADQIHPTLDGYTKMGNAWYDALVPFLGIQKTTRVQAENMTLTNYIVESRNSSALGQKVISVNAATNSIGTASFQFSGSANKYDVVVSYYDENDGQGQLKFKVGGNQVDQWTLNQNLGNASANSQTKLRRTVATGISLNPGTAIEIQGTANQGEYARIDYVEFIPYSNASFSAANITQASGTTNTISVTYTDEDGIDLSSIDNNDIRVTGPNNFNQLATLTGVNQSNGAVTGFYRINAPGGTWDTADNGTYTVVLQNNQVKDNSNNFFPGGNLGNFQVNLAQSGGNIRMEAENMQRTSYLIESNTAASNSQLISLASSGSSSGKVTSNFSGASGIYDVVVRYFDENDGQASVSAKIGGTQIVQWSFNQNLGNSGAVSQTAVTKTIASGLFINQGAAIELQGIANSGEFARIDYIEFLAAGTAPAASDVRAPTATLSATNITNTSNSAYTFTVTYTDDQAVDISSLDSSDLRVTGPNGFNQLATFVSLDSNTNGAIRTATYSLNPLGGSWDALDNGNYTVALQANQVKDTSGNFISGGNLGTFQVSVPQSNGTVRIEAESMQLTNYLVESNTAASSSKAIGLPKSGATSGIASTTFTGVSGSYDVFLRYFDENDGQAQLTTSIAGTQIDQRTLNQNLGSASPDNQSAVTQKIATALSINQGATIQIQGLANQAEYARVDYIEFIPVQQAPLTVINGTDSADILTGNSENNTINGFAGNDTLTGGAGNDSLNGGSGADLFVLAQEQGTDTISDFTDSQDVLGLSGGLTFQQLSIIQGTDVNWNNTLVKITSTDELLATLNGIQATSITVNDFTVV
ncbi:GDSL-type esterase/lipase family protein [Aerosakkonema funiforme]|uniref:SGNH hydrolase-type esterase domain-containing protein n=1 Tax=Aerosakkonema funiforme FACHB-1375 TaxID=2949571 RepID=A0A926ZEZ1_9CYAN|nr:GDSL-type esterase/lipase family protein [Aerosakkonema funiforme]MBD2180129.1 hypothetical protein [Aerosakkonema funiforme FACHB-1375]